MAHPVARWVRLWLHPRVVLELLALYVRWLHLIGNYCLNRALGASVDEMGTEMLDPRTPLRQVRRAMWRMFGRTGPLSPR